MLKVWMLGGATGSFPPLAEVLEPSPNSDDASFLTLVKSLQSIAGSDSSSPVYFSPLYAPVRKNHSGVWRFLCCTNEVQDLHWEKHD